MIDHSATHVNTTIPMHGLKSSLVDQLAVHPFLLPKLVSVKIFVHEKTVPLPFGELAVDAPVVLVFGLNEFAIFDVHFPSALVGLISRFALIDSLSIFLAVSEGALVGVTVAVYQLSFSVDFIVAKSALIAKRVSSLGDGQLAIPLFFALNEISLINVSVSIAE